MRIPESSRLWRSFLALTFIIGAAAMAMRAQQLPPQARTPAAVPNEFLVRYVEGETDARRTAAVRDSGAALLRRFANVGIDHVRLPAGVSMAGAVDALRATGSVLSVDPNYIRTIVETAPPNDPYWLSGYMWGLTKIGAQPAWTNFTTGSNTIVVADLDTGINYNHPDLAANVWTNPGEIPGNGVDDDGNGYVDDVYGIDTYNSDTNPMDDHGHGTHTANESSQRQEPIRQRTTGILIAIHIEIAGLQCWERAGV
jgi:serine protease